MWVDSKTAAAVLGVNLRTLQRKAINAQNKCQKILTIDTHKIMYQFIFSSRGGSSGKVLQIWLDEQSENKLISKGYNIEDISDTRTSKGYIVTLLAHSGKVSIRAVKIGKKTLQKRQALSQKAIKVA
ncbi:hypothetical protein A0W74_00940 [Campylobacter fetus]|nr:hypothetical protein [Campylobacter fetus]